MNKRLQLALVCIALVGGCDINHDFCSEPCPADDTFDMEIPYDLGGTDDTLDGFHLGPTDIDGDEM